MALPETSGLTWPERCSWTYRYASEEAIFPRLSAGRLGWLTTTPGG